MTLPDNVAVLKALAKTYECDCGGICESDKISDAIDRVLARLAAAEEDAKVLEWLSGRLEAVAIECPCGTYIRTTFAATFALDTRILSPEIDLKIRTTVSKLSPDEWGQFYRQHAQPVCPTDEKTDPYEDMESREINEEVCNGVCQPAPKCSTCNGTGVKS